MLMAIYTKESGMMTKLMEKESILEYRELLIKEIGRMICKMDKEKRLGQTVQFMKEPSLKARSMGEELCSLLTSLFTEETLQWAK
jgi:hypothetical protein